MNTLKKIFYPLYKVFINKQFRAFIYLYIRRSGYERFKHVSNVNFLNFTFNVPDMLSFIGQCKELFVDEIYNFQSKSSSPVIFDCGANVGTSCVYFKTLYPTAKIKAFEADDNITQYLRENLQHNNITDVDVIDSAVWIHSDGISFSCEGADGGSIQGSDNLNKVKSIRLRDYLQKEEIVDLLKIDIEGAEYEVLKDCKDTLDNVENIFIEYHSWNNSPQKLSEILAILEKNNFRYYISSISERSHPFINIGLDQNMDLQLNIFGVRRVKYERVIG